FGQSFLDSPAPTARPKPAPPSRRQQQRAGAPCAKADPTPLFELRCGRRLDAALLASPGTKPSRRSFLSRCNARSIVLLAAAVNCDARERSQSGHELCALRLLRVDYSDELLANAPDSIDDCE